MQCKCASQYYNYVPIDDIATKLGVKESQLWYILTEKTNDQLLDYLFDHEYAVTIPSRGSTGYTYRFAPEAHLAILKWLAKHDPQTFWQYFSQYESLFKKERYGVVERDALHDSEYKYKLELTVVIESDGSIRCNKDLTDIDRAVLKYLAEQPKVMTSRLQIDDPI